MALIGVPWLNMAMTALLRSSTVVVDDRRGFRVPRFWSFFRAASGSTFMPLASSTWAKSGVLSQLMAAFLRSGSGDLMSITAWASTACHNRFTGSLGPSPNKFDSTDAGSRCIGFLFPALSVSQKAAVVAVPSRLTFEAEAFDDAATGFQRPGVNGRPAELIGEFQYQAAQCGRFHRRIAFLAAKLGERFNQRHPMIFRSRPCRYARCPARADIFRAIGVTYQAVFHEFTDGVPFAT